MEGQARIMAPASSWKRLGIVLLLVATFSGACLVWIHGVHRVDPKGIESKIAQDLPIGSNTASVLHFLDSQNTRHSAYLAEYHRIYAEIDRSTIGLIKGHIHIEFNFDDNGKLVSYEVKELFDFL